MSSRRKPLPYAASALLEQAASDCQAARKALVIVLDKPLTPEEKYRLIGKAVHLLHEIERTLAEVPVKASEQ